MTRVWQTLWAGEWWWVGDEAGRSIWGGGIPVIGVLGREFVAKQVADWDNLCCTIFWHAVKKDK